MPMDEAMQLLADKIHQAKVIKELNASKSKKLDDYCDDRIKYLEKVMETLAHVKEHNSSRVVKYLG